MKVFLSDRLVALIAHPAAGPSLSAGSIQDQPNPPWYPAEPAHGVAPAQGKARMDQSSIDEAIRRAEMAEAQVGSLGEITGLRDLY